MLKRITKSTEYLAIDLLIKSNQISCMEFAFSMKETIKFGNYTESSTVKQILCVCVLLRIVLNYNLMKKICAF